MMNPLAGEVELVAGGETLKVRLTIDALVKIETQLGLGIIEIVMILLMHVRINCLIVILTRSSRWWK